MSEIIERPILLRPALAQKAYDGEKTQTRRLRGLTVVNEAPDVWTLLYVSHTNSAGRTAAFFKDEHTGQVEVCHCPYGKPGDAVWFREPFYQLRGPLDPSDINSDIAWVNKPGCARYGEEWYKPHTPGEFGYRKRVSIHMPRWASRTRVILEDIRCERVQEISTADAWDEGLTAQDIERAQVPLSQAPGYPVNAALRAFATLWDSINGKRGYAWDTNLFVWALKWEPHVPGSRTDEQ